MIEVFQYSRSSDPCELETKRKPFITFEDFLKPESKALDFKKLKVMGPTLQDLVDRSSIFKIREVCNRLISQGLVDPSRKGYLISELEMRIDRAICNRARLLGMECEFTIFRGEFVLRTLGGMESTSQNLSKRFISDVLIPASEELSKEFYQRFNKKRKRTEMSMPTKQDSSLDSAPRPTYKMYDMISDNKAFREMILKGIQQKEKS